MKIRIFSISTRQFSVACIEAFVVFLVLFLCGQWFLGGLIERAKRFDILSSGRENSGRLYRLFERKHVPTSVYDDVGTQDVDIPVYFLELPAGSGIIRELNHSDFSTIDQRALNQGFEEHGRGSCPKCFYRLNDMPFMNVTVRVAESNGIELLTILHFERTRYALWKWTFSLILCCCVCVYLWVGLRAVWHYQLKDLMSAFVGLAPTDNCPFLLGQPIDLFEISAFSIILIFMAPVTLVAVFLFQYL